MPEAHTLSDRRLLAWRSYRFAPLDGCVLLSSVSALLGGFCSAEAARPLATSDVSAALLDQPLPITDPQLAAQLFSPPLPVYETPWLERAPPQVWEARPGCEEFVAEVAVDLIDEGARLELESWYELARKDAWCP